MLQVEIEITAMDVNTILPDLQSITISKTKVKEYFTTRVQSNLNKQKLVSVSFSFHLYVYMQLQALTLKGFLTRHIQNMDTRPCLFHVLYISHIRSNTINIYAKILILQLNFKCAQFCTQVSLEDIKNSLRFMLLLNSM